MNLTSFDSIFSVVILNILNDWGIMVNYHDQREIQLDLDYYHSHKKLF